MSFTTISVVGLGYIGLPTAAAFASRQKQVVGVDINARAVDTINRGEIHIVEPDLDLVVKKAVDGGVLRASTTPVDADAFLIAVPTPFKGDHEPDMVYVEAAAKSIAPVLKKGALVILESTSPVGATEQTLLAAVLAEGKTELSGAATEPEIMDLVCVLQKMGAIISVDVDRTFRIEGVKELKGYTHTSLTDRIEAASWASAALATHGDIFVKGATQPEMMTFLNVFRKIGGEFDITDNGIRFWHPGGDLKPVAIETDVHPGFMTDWQQPLVVALTQAKGLSIVHETVYENRFGFTKPLVQMGATIQLYRECLGSLPCRFQQRNYKHSAVIFGPTPLTGRDIDVPDLRGGFSHLIAALAAKGPSNVQGISLIDRGYADFRGKLEALGADFD